jgi:hypothetical protein
VNPIWPSASMLSSSRPTTLTRARAGNASAANTPRAEPEHAQPQQRPDRLADGGLAA